MKRRTFIRMASMAMATSALGLPAKGMTQRSTGEKPKGNKALRKICVEEHFSTTDHLNYLISILQKKYPVPEVVQEEAESLAAVMPMLPAFLNPPLFDMIGKKLLDLDKVRLEDMDKHGIDTQVISIFSPGVQVFETSTATRLAKEYNDRLAVAANDHPKRFIGFAAIAPQDPAMAANELERAVTSLGFKGAIINSHTKGEYLDNKKYWKIFERAQKLNVPIYLHPRGPLPDMIKPYAAYPQLASAVWGFAADTSLHALRLIFSGLFDEFPKLKIILGHLGETIPFMLARINTRWSAFTSPIKLKKLPKQYFRDNFLVSTSGMNEDPVVLKAVIDILGSDNVLFATDYPFEDTGQAVNFIDNAPISENDRAKICHLNAERVFSL